MSRQLFINNTNAVPAADAGDTDPTDIAAERVAIFDADDWSSGTLQLTDKFTGDKLVIVQGGKSGEDAIISSIIDIDDVEAVYEKPYAAPVKQQTTVTTGTGTGFATVRVVKVSEGHQPHERVTAEVKLDGKTDAEITDEFVTLLNNHSPNFFTASNSGDNLLIEGDEGISFATSTDGEASGWTITATQTPNFGSGTSDHVKNLEEVAWGGNYQNRIYLPTEPPRYTVDGETYDLFTILVRTNTTENISKSNKYQEITIAVQATASGIDLPVFFGFEADSN